MMLPGSTPASISNNSVTPSGESTFALIPSCISLITDTILSGIPYVVRILSVFPRCRLSFF